MKLRIVTLVMMLALFGGVSARGPMAASASAAQATASPAAQSDQFDLSTLEGAQSGVERTYSGDLTALLGAVATPGAGAPDFSKIGLFSLQGSIITFDNADHAKAAVGTIGDQVTKGASSSVMGAKLNQEQVDVGDNSTAFSAQIDQQGLSASVFVVVAQKDALVYMSIGVAFSGDSVKDDTVNFAKALVDGKASDGEGDFKADGTSTGGLWDKFPASDDGVLKGLKVESDKQIPSGQ